MNNKYNVDVTFDWKLNSALLNRETSKLTTKPLG